MSLTPRVTVLLPFHNAANSLHQCIGSILNQTLRSFELLALDDGSQDDSVRQLTAMIQHDSRVRLVRTERSGLVRTLNLGLQLARAPLVARMDADDRMCPERLERQAEYMAAHPELVAVGSRVRVFPADVIGAGFYSRTDPRYSRAAFDRVRAHYLAKDPRLNQGRELIFWGAGRKTRRRSDLLVTRGHRPTA